MDQLDHYREVMDGQGYAFEVRYDERVGKHCVAVQDIAADEELIIEAPLVVWPHAEEACQGSAHPICEVCFAPLTDDHPTSCRNDWLQYFPTTSILTARTWQLAKDKSCSVTLEALGRSIARILWFCQTFLEQGATPEQAFVSSALPFYRLCTPEGQLGEWVEEYRGELVGLVKVPPGAHAELAALKERALSAAFVEHLIGGICLNAHTVLVPGYGRGSGVYTLTATLNHTCAPSARVETVPDTVDVSVKANGPAVAGSQVTISYVPEGLNTAQRQSRLEKYGFQCDCTLCQ